MALLAAVEAGYGRREGLGAWLKVHCILIGTYATHYAADLNCRKLC